MREKFVYLLLFTVGSGLALLKMLLAARSVSPAEFGLYTLLLITAAILSYASSVGIFEAFLVRLNPSRTAATERAILRDSGLVGSFALSILISALAIGILYVMKLSLSSAAMILVALYFVVNNLLNGLMMEVQAAQRPVEYSACLVVKSALPVVLLADGFGGRLEDILLFDVTAMVLIVIFLLWRSGGPSPVRVSLLHVRQLVREGGPFTANAAALNVANNLDKWAVGFALGPAQLGFYAFAGQLITMGMAFASMVQIYMYPRIIAQVSSHSEDAGLGRRTLKLAAISGFLCLFGIFLVILAGYVFIPALLPQYEAAIPLLPVLGFAAVVIGANHAEIVFRLTHRGRDYFLIQLGALLTTGVVYAVLILCDARLLHFALAFAFGRLGQALVGYVRALTLARRAAAIG
ncbi:oligosaccharide flippase family protein [Sphingosinicella sp.]|uniref:lipopolysaccharide biosynthesis protein n=1 Tax=Sphingosinicella sp. TaxID=1917971 RepID=UPI00260FC2BB|nr:oligosaccharide flippase family protein [Sphingosinicella sp.]